jgi:predicted Zn-dependent peptidase
MIFDGGSPTLPDNKTIKGWSKQHTLNSWNATTEFYQTYYRLRCLLEEYNSVMSGIKDMIFNSYLRAEDVERERRVIMQEAWNNFLNEKLLRYQKEFSDNLFHGHDRARVCTALGWPDTIVKISQEDIKNWHKANYGIGNMHIVLAGAVEEKHINFFRKTFGGFTKS